MRVAFCIRGNFLVDKGGDTTQVLKTKEFLESYKNDIYIDIVTESSFLDNSYDIVHIFNFANHEQTETFYNKAKKLNIPIVFSSIFWDYSFSFSLFSKYKGTKFFFYLDRFIFQTLAKIFNRPYVLSPSFKKNIRKYMDNASCILPNSYEEFLKICNFLKIKEDKYKKKIKVVVNAALTSPKSNVDKKSFLKKYNIEADSYILQVGRIQSLKGQLNLVRALKDEKFTILFIGAIAENKYKNKILKEKTNCTVRFIDHVPYEELSLFYKFAKIHVLPSMRESPGLVSLEALINKCQIVVGNEKYCPYDTYFKNRATSIDVLNLDSIKRGIFKELSTIRDREKNREFVLNNFSWNRAAEQTYFAYKKILYEK